METPVFVMVSWRNTPSIPPANKPFELMFKVLNMPTTTSPLLKQSENYVFRFNL